MKVGIIGATGLVGQRFVQLLNNHPYFEISELVASEESVNKAYEDAVENKIKRIPKEVKGKNVSAVDDDLDCQVVFSALPSRVAGEAERSLVERGHVVLTNASSHRMEEGVPLVIPEVNPDHVQLVERWVEEKDQGFIVANPNCSTIQLALALKPIYDRFCIDKVNVVTLQALSGAGYGGVAALEAADNVIPYIPGEEEKIEKEMLKIFGKLDDDGIERDDLTVSASCNRVNVSDGHLESVSIETSEKPELSELKGCLKDFKGVPQELNLPSAPKRPVVLCKGKDRPQPRVDLEDNHSMSVYVGRVRKDSILDYKFTVLGHNTIRGAAGASVLNAELLHSRGYLGRGEIDE
ncbi:MAG: aspartate-semialdehyde dehydrogenase [Candidatus Saliniplasma sp.]